MLGENTALSQNPDDGQGRTPTVLCDRFVLEARLNHGRLGTMYRARDRLRAQDGRSYVAVLMLPSEVARSPEQLAAFEHALAEVRMLSHPNIVRIFSLERDGDRAFLVLEWVDGESLRSVIDSLVPETVCEADALGVVRAVGNALVYAHARGIVHGDLRPENVLVTERGEVRLLFASACLARTGPFEIGPRDDVRGLAALAYELMSGAPPPIGGLYPRGKADEPEPIEGVSRKRWKALRSAMSVRDGRISSVPKLLAALDLPEPRAPRRGSRPDRLRRANGGIAKRVASAVALCVFIVVLVAVGLMLWNERGDELPELAELPATIESGADRAGEVTREGLSGARQGLERAGDALASLWGQVGRRLDGPPSTDEGELSETVAPGDGAPVTVVPDGGDGGAASPVESERETAAARATADEAIRGAELTEPEELDRIGADVEADPAVGSDGGVASSARGPLDRQSQSGTEGVSEGSLPPDVTSNDEMESSTVRDDSAVGDDSRGRASADAAAAREGAVSGSVPATDVSGPAPDETIAASTARFVFARGEYIVSESEGVAAIEVERSDPRGDISFVWWTRDGSATSGDDYADLGRSVEQIGDGVAVTVLYVPITSDSIVEERSEYFEVHLGVLSAEGNQNGALESARVTIVDDDR